MKLKHSALFALAVWAGIVVWIGFMVVAKPKVFTGYAGDDESGAAALLQQQIAHATRLKDALGALSAPRLLAMDRAIVANPPARGAQDALAADGGTGPLQVSMIIATDRTRRALVGGELVRRGSRLADGSIVRAIGSDWVRIEDATGLPMILKMPRPFAADAAGAQP